MQQSWRLLTSALLCFPVTRLSSFTQRFLLFKGFATLIHLLGLPVHLLMGRSSKVHPCRSPLQSDATCCGCLYYISLLHPLCSSSTFLSCSSINLCQYREPSIIDHLNYRGGSAIPFSVPAMPSRAGPRIKGRVKLGYIMLHVAPNARRAIRRYACSTINTISLIHDGGSIGMQPFPYGIKRV